MGKIKIENQAFWPHLRSGWGVVNSRMLSLHNPRAKVLFEDYLDGVFGSQKKINHPWVGFFHNTPKNHFSTNSLYGFKNDTSLEFILNSDNFRDSIGNCLGIFTLSFYLEKFINDKFPSIKTNSIFLCTENPKLHFDFYKFKESPSIVTIGHWQRLFNNINKIKGIQKKFLKWSSNVNINWWFEKHGIEKNEDLKVIERLNNEEYDIMLEKTVVFLELFDAAANNIVVECIVRNTPVVVNRLQGLSDYLGKEYPLFYENFEEAQIIVNDNDKILEGHEYLKKLDKRKFHPDFFINSFKNSSIYHSLPSCPSYKIF